ncbi:Zn-ribbon domain-containing OB-fold protein [Pseudomonas mangiferae]|uniref:Zn-ribbon domain-containing OB-fold protein n=1 Tax=Pseudomonas mangiferae TaxID=2593654 RepID=A0A553H464_9PSED|nr:Zn-ribbon domain-containing OB-fold protein [Pseudomonas mangiferae]TRX76539.1 Zn-ribbon domain-containing OB-fold protein [Pseudomonas mangiferae]
MHLIRAIVRDEISRPWWQALNDGRLLVQRDPRSGALQWYPRGHCLADPLRPAEWVEVSGRGTLFSFSVIHRSHRKPEQPYVCALVELEEGPLMLSQLTGMEDHAVHIGMPVRVSFVEFDEDGALPVFVPETGSRP